MAAPEESKVQLTFTYAESQRVYRTFRASLPAEQAREFGRLADEDEDKALAYLLSLPAAFDNYVPALVETGELDEPDRALLEWEEIR